MSDAAGHAHAGQHRNPQNGDVVEGTAANPPLLEVENVTRTYQLPREKLWSQPPKVHALQGVSFQMAAGRSLGIVGESGSGKSTLARLVMALESPTSGSVQILGRDMATLDAISLRQARRDFQMVFQDPYGSLDPRQTVLRIVTEPLQAQDDTSKAEQAQRAQDVLKSVGLRATDLEKYPHEFSGGQRQRIAIARALITRPRLIVADEPVSALDVSVQAQVLNLMQDLQAEFDVTYLLISHDLAVVDHLCADVAVIFQGRIVEQGAPQTLFRQAAHPYTQALLDAVPRMEPRAPGTERKRTLAVEPVRLQMPGACPYAHRCPSARERCDVERPELKPLGGAAHRVACHFPLQGDDAGLPDHDAAKAPA